MPISTVVYPFTEAGRVRGARFVAFATGSATPLQAHKAWIRDHFAPKMKQHPGAWIDLLGYASRKGNADLNMRLSQQRLQAIESEIRACHPGIRINLRIPQGESSAENDTIPDGNDDAYWRAVLVRWYGVPLDIPVPRYPPAGGAAAPAGPAQPQGPYRPAPGWWLITGFNTIGVSFGATVGAVRLTLSNWKGEHYEVYGAGWGGGPSVDFSGGKVVNLAAKLLQMLPGALGTVADIQEWFGLADPTQSRSAGFVSRGGSRTSGMNIGQITSEGWFTVVSGTAHQFGVAGADLALLSFTKVMDTLDLALPAGQIYHTLTRVPTAPWGIYVGGAVKTMRAALGVSFSEYKIASVTRIQTEPDWEQVWTP